MPPPPRPKENILEYYWAGRQFHSKRVLFVKAQMMIFWRREKPRKKRRRRRRRSSRRRSRRRSRSRSRRKEEEKKG